MNQTNSTVNLDENFSAIPVDNKEEEYIFLDKNTRVGSIEKIFHDYAEKRKKLSAIFLTNSGNSDTPIEGIITAWDLPLISEQTA